MTQPKIEMNTDAESINLILRLLTNHFSNILFVFALSCRFYPHIQNNFDFCKKYTAQVRSFGKEMLQSLVLFWKHAYLSLSI